MAPSLLLRDTKHRRATLDSRGAVLCCFHQRVNFFLDVKKNKNKEKPKIGPRPSPRLNYDVKIGPMEALEA